MLYGTLNISPQDLDAVVVTHEHTDHIQSIGNLSKKFNLPIYATSETFDAMPVQTDKISSSNRKNININNEYAKRQESRREELHAKEKISYQKIYCNNDNFFINNARHDANIK